MTREEFREAVFSRDKYRCVHCRAEAVDAHHLLERRLWPDGGYIPDNGVSLCGDCHLLAEQTLLPRKSFGNMPESRTLSFPCICTRIKSMTSGVTLF